MTDLDEFFNEYVRPFVIDVVGSINEKLKQFGEDFSITFEETAAASGTNETSGATLCHFCQRPIKRSEWEVSVPGSLGWCHEAFEDAHGKRKEWETCDPNVPLTRATCAEPPHDEHEHDWRLSPHMDRFSRWIRMVVCAERGCTATKTVIRSIREIPMEQRPKSEWPKYEGVIP